MTGKPQTCTAQGCTKKPAARRLCRTHYQQAWKTGQLESHKKLPTRPRIRDRKICPVDHKHATNTTCFIQHQCRCDPCMDHNAQRARQRKKNIAYGRYDTGLVDPTPVREHLLMLSEYGIGYKRVSKMCGFKSATPVRTILWGRQDPGPRFGEMQKRIKRETANKILRIQPTLENLADGRAIPALGAHRRIQALVNRGWSMRKISELAGINPSNFSAMLTRDRIQVATHKTIAELYNRLWNEPPPETTWHDKSAATRARNHAKKMGWVAPLAWDNIDLDKAPHTDTQTEFTIDEQAIELACSGLHVPLHPKERRVAVEKLHRQRLSDSTIADTLGCEPRTVLKIREELHLRGWTSAEQKEAKQAA